MKTKASIKALTDRWAADSDQSSIFPPDAVELDNRLFVLFTTALSEARAETWKQAMKIANDCIQEHDHTPDEEGERLNPAACVYFALESARDGGG